MDHRQILYDKLPPMQKPKNSIDPGVRACIIIPGIFLVLLAIGSTIYTLNNKSNTTLENTRTFFEDIAISEGRYHHKHGRYGTLNEIWENHYSSSLTPSGDFLVEFGVRIHVEVTDEGKGFLATCSYGGRQMRMDESGEIEVVPVE